MRWGAAAAAAAAAGAVTASASHASPPGPEAWVARHRPTVPAAVTADALGETEAARNSSCSLEARWDGRRLSVHPWRRHALAGSAGRGGDGVGGSGSGGSAAAAGDDSAGGAPARWVARAFYQETTETTGWGHLAVFGNPDSAGSSSSATSAAGDGAQPSAVDSAAAAAAASRDAFMAYSAGLLEGLCTHHRIRDFFFNTRRAFIVAATYPDAVARLRALTARSIAALWRMDEFDRLAADWALETSLEQSLDGSLERPLEKSLEIPHGHGPDAHSGSRQVGWREHNVHGRLRRDPLYGDRSRVDGGARLARGQFLSQDGRQWKAGLGAAPPHEFERAPRLLERAPRLFERAPRLFERVGRHVVRQTLLSSVRLHPENAFFRLAQLGGLQLAGMTHGYALALETVSGDATRIASADLGRMSAYLMAAGPEISSDGPDFYPELDLIDMFILSEDEDLPDLHDALKPELAPTWKSVPPPGIASESAPGDGAAGSDAAGPGAADHDSSRALRSRERISRCSGFVRLTADELYVGHATWDVFTEMVRIAKVYRLPYAAAKAHTVAMTSYPASLISTDDFTVALPTKIVTTETTVDVIRRDLFRRKTHAISAEGKLPDFLRGYASARVAETPAEWADAFADNTEHFVGVGTAQWLVTSFSAFERWRAAPVPSRNVSDLFYVVEAVPGVVVARDASPYLVQRGHWGSFNRAIFRASREALEEDDREVGLFERIIAPGTGQGREFTFTKLAPLVNSRAEMAAVMQLNVAGRQTPHTGFLPGTMSVAPRFDLAAGPGEHVRPGGGIDAKFVDSRSVDRGAFFARAGPSHVLDPPFTWRERDGSERFERSKIARQGMPELWNFPWVGVTAEGFAAAPLEVLEAPSKKGAALNGAELISEVFIPHLVSQYEEAIRDFLQLSEDELASDGQRLSRVSVRMGDPDPRQTALLQMEHEAADFVAA